MKRARIIPDALRAAQLRAADPERAVFVSANAGSGKTWVLTQRVINLLLGGVDPSRILCITYTKAAAANMANEVFYRLSQWTALDDAAFDAKIRETIGKAPDAAQRARARRLFATALETPGGLKVETIHAFCTRLLHQFPFEADVAARFDVLDESATTQLLDRLTLDAMLDGAADPDGPLGWALATAITAAADMTFKDVIAETIHKRDVISAWVNAAGDVKQAIEQINQEFQLSARDSLQTLEDECFSQRLIPESEWPTLFKALASSPNKTDRDLVEAFKATQTLTGAERIRKYRHIFCTDKLKPRARVLTATFAQAHPLLLERFVAEQDRICRLIEKENAVVARDRSAALLLVASTVIGSYAREKDERGLLDYDDLIDRTLALFRNTSAAWVLYKLDLGIDHVLVDEAQDTSPKQWEIIRTIVAEFAPGGARDNVRRTLFAVGDEKQSIFSFQGAAPRSFAQNRDHFERLYRGSQTEFAVEKLHYSFRSATEVLGAVDEVFKRPEAFRGLADEPVPTVHTALPDAAPGEVEIWDLIAPDEKDEDKEGWDAPFDTTTESSPAIKLSRKIGRRVKAWCAAGTSPRDVLVLVRQRGPLFEAVIRALKRENIPVAGADRLVLTEHIAVMDLLVLGDALLLPSDDLALATVLKSPLFGLDESQLFTLAHKREGSLRSALWRKAGDDPTFDAANRALNELEQHAREMTPFAFYAHVLGPLKGRRRILARLGVEADDPLNEFLNFALDYERRETPSLQGFLHWIRIGQNEVKRDMELGRDEVRVMTVHGAKGLEARNVILIDATTVRPEGAYPPRLLEVPLNGAARGATALIWGGRKDRDAGPMAAARTATIEAAKDEYRRLLYVGMTRAAERLVVCGTKGVHKIPEGCWYELVCDALKEIAKEATDPDGDRIWRMRTRETPQEPAAREDTRQAALPDWLEEPASPPPRPRTVSPSDTREDARDGFAGSGNRDKALRRGSLIHRLLQSLPDIAPQARQAAATAYLAKQMDITDIERAEMSAQALRILNDSRFAPLFAPGSRAEISIAGHVQIGSDVASVAGQIDRLVVTDTEILIADYKTNRPAPTRITDSPRAYVLQLALYRAVLQKIYPTKPVRAALIWTETPELMELSQDSLDHALLQFTSA